MVERLIDARAPFGRATVWDPRELCAISGWSGGRWQTVTLPAHERVTEERPAAGDVRKSTVRMVVRS